MGRHRKDKKEVKRVIAVRVEQGKLDILRQEGANYTKIVQKAIDEYIKSIQKDT